MTETAIHSSKIGTRMRSVVAPLLAGASKLIGVSIMLLLAWYVIGRLTDRPELFPAPPRIISCFVSWPLWGASASTACEAVFGLALAFVMASLVSCIFVLAPILKEWAFPWVFAFQAIPLVAIAPITINVIGFGFWGNSVLASLVAVWVLIIYFVKGLESVPQEATDLFGVLNASKFEVLMKLRIPFAAQDIFVGLRTGAALSVVGAIVAEFLQPDNGLGAWIIKKNYGSYFAEAYGGVIMAAALSLALVALVTGVELLVKHRREVTRQLRRMYVAARPRAITPAN